MGRDQVLAGFPLRDEVDAGALDRIRKHIAVCCLLSAATAHRTLPRRQAQLEIDRFEAGVRAAPIVLQYGAPPHHTCA